MNNNGKYQIEILNPEDTLDEWDQFVDRSPQGVIFCRSWWLKAACQNDFQILVVKRGDEIVGGLPLPYKFIMGRKIIKPPTLSMGIGVLLAPSGNKLKYEKRLSEEMKVLNILAENLPNFHEFQIVCHPSFTNWMPFYWAGYSQTTMYTYAFEGLTNLDRVFSGFNYSKKKNMKKAEKLVSICEDLPSNEFYANHVTTLKKQGQAISYSYEYFERLYNATYKHNAGKIWYAIDSKQAIHAAIFVVFDKKSAYYLISTIDPDFRNSGAATLLLREAIKYTSQYTNRFDFEGSMIKGVENSFRKFGAIQEPYFCISKGKRIASLLQTLVERILIKYGIKH